VSKIRGFNYQSAPTIGHAEHWLLYDPAETERDMDYAKRLNLNQVRVLTPYVAYVRDKAAFRKNLVHLVRACHQRGIGVMITPMWPRNETPTESPLSRVGGGSGNTIGNGKRARLGILGRPQRTGRAAFRVCQAHATCSTSSTREPRWVIGATTEANMETIGSDAVDVLCFHDYSPTRRADSAPTSSAPSSLRLRRASNL